MSDMQFLTDQDRKTIDTWVAKFPSENKKSAVLMALRTVQDRVGYLTDEHMEAGAQYLSIPQIAVYEVASFYSMYRRSPVGKRVIKVCTSLSCCLLGAHGVIESFEKKLGVKLGQTTEDGKVTLMETECLAACCNAPAAIIDDKDYQFDIDQTKVDAIVNELMEDSHE